MESGLKPGTWHIDTIHSQVMVSVWHFNVGNFEPSFLASDAALT
jgi:polyisoprenoid-binding protein YceI